MTSGVRARLTRADVCKELCVTSVGRPSLYVENKAEASRNTPARRFHIEGASFVFSTHPTLSFSSATSHHRPFWLPVG